MTKKYASLSSLQTFLENLRNVFSPLSHKHNISDMTDYVVDAELSSTSTNPVQNKVINEEFNAISDGMGALELAIDGKADAEHNHDSIYYTETEIDIKLSEVNESIGKITSGTTVVKESEHATSADTAVSADTATKAVQDSNGNVIKDTYETKTDASAKLEEAKTYADTAAETIKSELLNGAGEAYDTLKELGDLINENTDALDALEIIADGKADRVHEHDDIYYTEKEIDAKLLDMNEYIVDVVNEAHFVSYNEQKLTDEQKEQARINIGTDIATDDEILEMLVQVDVLPVVTDADGAILADENENILLW